MTALGWRTAAAAAVAAALSPAPVAWAQSAEARIAAFEAADVDANGSIDVNEYVAYFVAGFAEMDTNDDETLAGPELGPAAPRDVAFADRDGDGALDLSEVVADRMLHFFKIDRNRNGVFTLEELLAYEEDQ